jgi:hypothetical protein
MFCRLINNKFRYFIIPNLLKKGGLVKNPKKNYFLSGTTQIENKTKSERFPEEKDKTTNGILFQLNPRLTLFQISFFKF